MRSEEVVGRLRSAGHAIPEGHAGKIHLAAEMKRHGVAPQAVRADGNRSHYYLADIDAALRKTGNVA